MLNNKAVLYSVVFAILAISFKLYVFYGGLQITRLGVLSHLIIIGSIFPFVLLLLFQMRKSNDGALAGKQAFKEALKFVVISALIISLFNYIFHQVTLGDYIRNYIAEYGPKAIKEGALKAGKAVTDEDIKKEIQYRIEDATAFKDTTGKLFSMVLVGGFFSLIGSMLLRRKV
jgi:hypothetical protein